MSESRQRLAQVLLVSVASVFALAATVPQVAVQRDPTRPPSFTSEPGAAPTLSGGGRGAPSSPNRLTATVVAAGTTSFAIVDGQRVEEGDFVAGAKVVQIDPASVTLRGRSGPYELRFYALPVKVEPGSIAELAARVGSSVKTDSNPEVEPTAEVAADVEPDSALEAGAEVGSASDAEGPALDD